MKQILARWTRTYRKFGMEKAVPSTSKNTGSNSVSQNLINWQILQLLTVLSQWLDNIETAYVKKTSDKGKVKKTCVQKQKTSAQTSHVTASGHQDELNIF